MAHCSVPPMAWQWMASGGWSQPAQGWCGTTSEAAGTDFLSDPGTDSYTMKTEPDLIRRLG